MEEKKVKTTVWVALLYKKQYLIARRSDKVKNTGLWNFFGGQLDPDEDVLTCAVREVYEEATLVIDPANLTLFTIYELEEDIIHLYICHVDKKVKPVLNQENDLFYWVNENNFKKLSMANKLHKATALYAKDLV